jgi:hypothetical protein
VFGGLLVLKAGADSSRAEIEKEIARHPSSRSRWRGCRTPLRKNPARRHQEDRRRLGVGDARLDRFPGPLIIGVAISKYLTV